MELRKHIAQLLVDHNILKFNVKEPFRYTSGLLSPIYINCRDIMGYLNLRKEIIDGLKQTVNENINDFDGFSGTAWAGLTWATILAMEFKKYMIYVREKPKEYGLKKQIEGRYEEGNTFVITEDHITTGGSVLTEIDVLRNAGLKINQCIAIFTYGLPEANKKFKEKNIKVHTLTSIQDALDTCIEKGKLSDNDIKSVQEWLNNPKVWSDKRNGKRS